MKNTVLSCPFDLSESTSRIMWEVTGKCNLNCRHCLYFDNQKKSAPDLNLEQITEILDGVVLDGQIKAIWISGGEPLLRKDLVSIVKEISKRGIIPSISTNGTLLTDKLANDLYNAGVRYVHLSIDGATAEVHDRLRNTPGAFESVMKGIDCLKSNSIRIGATYMVTWESIDQVPDMIVLGQEKGLDVLSFYLVAPIGRGSATQSPKELELMKALEKAVLPYRDLPDLKIEVFRTVSEEEMADPSVGLMECKGYYFYTITNDGHLTGCPWFAKNNSPVKPINLLENNFAQAKRIICEQMKKHIEERKKNLSAKCAACKRKDNCGVGCLAVSEIDGKDPLCRYLQ